jgi:hypothetical protein
VPALHLLDRPIDPRGPRFVAAVTTVVLALALLTGSAWLLLAQAVVFALGTVDRSPYAIVFRTLVRPRLAPPPALEDPRPVRFAQSIGLTFALVALAGVGLGAEAVTVVATAAALAAALLNSAFGICLGCELYLLLARARGRRDTDPTSPTHRTPTEVSA